jgi:ABC-type amino acid transport substrate-binding protein
MYLGDDEELHGFYVDLEKMVMEEMGQTYRMTPYSDVGPITVGLKSGIYQIALAAPDVIDYRSFLNLSIPYEVLHYVTFVQSGNSDIKGSTREELIKSLYGKKVGVQTQGHIYQVFREIRKIEMVEYPTTTQALEDLDKGLLDAVPDVKRIGLYYAAKNGWNIEPRGEAIINHKITTAFSQRLDTSLLDRYNKALQTIISDGRLESLYVSSFGEMNEEDKPWLTP